MTDRILVRDVLVRAKEEQERRVLSPYPEPMASISAQERALLSHAVPDQSGTRRVVIEQRAGEDAVLLGLDADECGCGKCEPLYRRHASLVGVLRQIAAGTVSDPQSWAQRIVAGTEAQNCDPDVCAICGEIYCPGCELAGVEKVMVPILRTWFGYDCAPHEVEHYAENAAVDLSWKLEEAGLLGPFKCRHAIYHHGCPSCDRQDPEDRE